MAIVADRERGFSLVELVTVFVLIGILSVAVVSRLNISTFQAVSFDEELRSAIRFAQKFAIVSGCDVRVNIDAVAGTYALDLRVDVNTGINAGVPASCLTTANLGFGTPLRNPSGRTFPTRDFAGTAPAGVAIAGQTFAYNRQGIPFDPNTGDPLAANINFTVGGRSFIVHAGTGYVQ